MINFQVITFMNYLCSTKPDPDNNFCLKFCRVDGKIDESSIKFSVGLFYIQDYILIYLVSSSFKKN